MENPLHEAHEQIEQLDEKPESRLKVVITVAILVVTMLTTAAGVLAAIWSARQSETQRERQQSATTSLQESVTANSQLLAVDGLKDDIKEDTWRKTFLHVYTLEVSDKTIDSELQKQADRRPRLPKQLSTRLPAGANSDDYTDKLYEKSLADSQLASAYAQESSGWLEKHNGALAVVSILALSLFLLGLALTLGNRATQVGFTALAIVMTVVGGARLLQVQLSDITAPTEDVHRHGGCSQRRHGADALRRRGHQAATRPSRSCPDYVDAWSQLANTLLLLRRVLGKPRSPRRPCLQAEQADQAALNVADVKTGVLYNDLGVHADPQPSVRRRGAEHGRRAQALPREPLRARHSRRARDRPRRPEDGVPLPDEAALSLKDAGPYFRDHYFFTSLRYDSGYFALAGITGAKVDAFFSRAREYEAMLDLKNMAHPLDTHGAAHQRPGLPQVRTRCSAARRDS